MELVSFACPGTSRPRVFHLAWIASALAAALLFVLLPAPFALASILSQGSLAWDPVDDPDLAGYKVHYGQACGEYDTTVDVGNDPSFTISGLEPGVTYYFAVTAYDANGAESDYSEEIAYEILPAGPEGDSVREGCSGNLPDDPTCRQGVFLAFAGREGDYRLSYTAYDISQADEVAISVNGTGFGYVPVTPAGEYSETLSLDLPADLLYQDAYNIVRFTPTFAPADAYNWGVCGIGFHSRALTLTDGDGDWYGNLSTSVGTDRDHLEHVQFLYDAPTEVPAEGIRLRFNVYDVDTATEIEVLVNGVHLAYAPLTENQGYSGLIDLEIPAAMLDLGQANLITFANTYNPENSYVWGVGNVSMAQPCTDCIPLPAADAYGRISNGDQSHLNSVSYSLPATAGNVVLLYEVWDVDFSGEVEILVNGMHAAYAPLTQNTSWSGPEYLVIPDELVLDSQPNVVTFDNLWNPPNTYWWGVRNVSVFEGCYDCIPLPETEAFGRVSGEDLTHPEEVNYLFEGSPGDLDAVYQVWDVDFADEVEILVNGAPVDHAATTPNATWSEVRTVALPDEFVLDTGLNVLTFSNTYNPPKTYVWGVRNVAIVGACPDCIPLTDTGVYGRIKEGDLTHPEEVSYSFQGAPGDKEIGYRVWDVDNADEVEILVNGSHLAYAPVTANMTWSDTQYIVIPDGLILDTGTNVLTFNNTNNPPNTYSWAVTTVSGD